MNDIDKLLAIEEIKKLFARRVRYMDLKQWDKYGSVHTEDAYSESYADLPAHQQPTTDGIVNKVQGPQALAAMIKKVIQTDPPITSVHHAHQPEIEITSDTTATGIWPMEDHLWWQNGDKQEFLHGYGHYYENYRKVDSEWLICYRKLTRLKVEVTPNFHDRLSN